MTNTIEYPHPLPNNGHREGGGSPVWGFTRVRSQTLPDGQNPLYHDLQPQVVGQRGYAGRVLYAG